MPQILLVVGAVLALAGIGGVAAGAPDWLLGLSVGATLIQSGMIALVGGLLLIGLSLVLTALQELLHRLEEAGLGAPPLPSRQPARSLPAPDGPAPREEVPPPEEPARPRREMPTRFAAEEGARPRADTPRDHPAEETPRPRREAPPQIISGEEPRPRREAAQGFGFEEQAARSRRERSLEQTGEDIARLRGTLPFRPNRPRREAGPSQPPLPGEERRRPRPPAEEPPALASEGYAPKFRPAEQASRSERAPASETVVRSGVIGGMAYTLYADGSIEAELPIGTVRFASIAELQDHVTRTGEEADSDFDEQNR